MILIEKVRGCLELKVRTEFYFWKFKRSNNTKETQNFLLWYIRNTNSNKIRQYFNSKSLFSFFEVYFFCNKQFNLLGQYILALNWKPIKLFERRWVTLFLFCSKQSAKHAYFIIWGINFEFYFMIYHHVHFMIVKIFLSKNRNAHLYFWSNQKYF